MCYKLRNIAIALLSAGAALMIAGPATAQGERPAQSGYRVLKTIPLPGVQAFDYLSMDSDARRLYVARQDHVAVVDVDKGTLVGNIDGLKGVHGIALAPDLGRGFTTNGGDQTSTIVDLKTMQKIGTVKTAGRNPDSMAYDRITKRVFIMDAASNDVTVIDAVSGTFVGSVPLEAHRNSSSRTARGTSSSTSPIRIRSRRSTAGRSSRSTIGHLRPPTTRRDWRWTWSTAGFSPLASAWSW